jgi:hypothetical protein
MLALKQHMPCHRPGGAGPKQGRACFQTPQREYGRIAVTRGCPYEFLDWRRIRMHMWGVPMGSLWDLEPHMP